MKRVLNRKLLILLIPFVFLSCSKNDAESEEAVNKEITAVKVEKVTKANLYDFFTTNGNVRASNSLEVYSAVSGRLVSLSVKLGQKVSKGDLLALVDPGLNGGNFSLYHLQSPVSGTILSLPPAAGSILSTEKSFVTIGNLDELKIVSYVPERYYGRLKAGLKARVKVEAYENLTFTAKVDEVSPVIDEENRTCEISLSFTDNNSKVVAGMFADLSIILEEFNNQLSLPEDCVVQRDGETFVYKAEESQNSYFAKLCKVKTGNSYNHRKVITEGISEGDLIITEGYETIADGNLLNVVQEVVYESN